MVDAAVDAAGMENEFETGRGRSLVTKADGARDSTVPDALSLVVSYLAELRTTLKLDEASPVVCWYGQQWYQWDGGCWRVGSEEEQADRVGHFVVRQGISVDEALVRQLLINLRMMTVLDAPSQRPPFYLNRVSPLHAEPCRGLVVRNGVLDLSEIADRGKVYLRPQDSRYFATRGLDCDYDPNARCSEWRRRLAQILTPRDEHDQREQVIQEFFGYLLLDDCRFEKMLILLGDGSNGKSVILNVAKAVLGAANTSHVSLGDLGEPFRLHPLAGKMANISRETDPKAPLNASLFKSIVSGEAIDLDRKHRESVTQHITAKLMIAANRLPTFDDDSEGMWRRLLVVPFDQYFDESHAEVDLSSRLIEEELPGVLNWSLEGLARLLKQGRFSSCARCEQAHGQHRAACDPVRSFMDACCMRAPDSGIERDELHKLYSMYCRMNFGGQVRVLNRAGFGRRLRTAWDVGDDRASTPDDTGRRPWLYGGVTLSDYGKELYRVMLHGEGKG